MTLSQSHLFAMTLQGFFTRAHFPSMGTFEKYLEQSGFPQSRITTGIQGGKTRDAAKTVAQIKKGLVPNAAGEKWCLNGARLAVPSFSLHSLL